PAHRPLTDQAEIRLVDQRGRLKRVIASLATQATACDAAQLRVHKRHQPVERSLAALAPVDEQLGDVLRCGVAHGRRRHDASAAADLAEGTALSIPLAAGNLNPPATLPPPCAICEEQAVRQGGPVKKLV